MGRDWNVREFSVNVISRFTICGNCEISEWQFSLFFVILSEKLAKFCVISREITGILRDSDFTTQTWSETWFCEMLNIEFTDPSLYWTDCEKKMNALKNLLFLMHKLYNYFSTKSKDSE